MMNALARRAWTDAHEGGDDPVLAAPTLCRVRSHLLARDQHAPPRLRLRSALVRARRAAGGVVQRRRRHLAHLRRVCGALRRVAVRLRAPIRLRRRAVQEPAALVRQRRGCISLRLRRKRLRLRLSRLYDELVRKRAETSVQRADVARHLQRVRPAPSWQAQTRHFARCLRNPHFFYRQLLYVLRGCELAQARALRLTHLVRLLHLAPQHSHLRVLRSAARPRGLGRQVQTPLEAPLCFCAEHCRSAG